MEINDASSGYVLYIPGGKMSKSNQSLPIIIFESNMYM